MDVLDNLPLWAFFIVVLIVSTLWAEGGYRFGTIRRKGLKEGDVHLDPLGTIVASILGLLAFMLAFTFNVALNRFDDRRVAVLSEANDIGTAYLRADFIEEPQQAQIKKLFREYVQVRQTGVGGSDSEQVVSKSEELQNQIWAISRTVSKAHDSPLSAIYIESLNDVIDIHSDRVELNSQARVPLSVWLVLFAISLLSMASVGYYSGMSENKSRVETLILTVSFAIVMFLVADLDRPESGLIKTNQQPMIDLGKQLGPP